MTLTFNTQVKTITTSGRTELRRVGWRVFSPTPGVEGGYTFFERWDEAHSFRKFVGAVEPPESVYQIVSVLAETWSVKCLALAVMGGAAGTLAALIGAAIVLR